METLLGGLLTPCQKKKIRQLTTSFYGTEVTKEAFGNIAKFGKITAPGFFVISARMNLVTPLFYFIISKDTWQGPNPENLSKICQPLFWQLIHPGTP